MKKYLILLILFFPMQTVQAGQTVITFKTLTCDGWSIVVNQKKVTTSMKNGKKWFGNIIWEHNPRSEVIGTSRPDLILVTGTVNSKIRGMDGNDVICGGEGNDFINGNRGNDIVYGRKGNDVLHGGKNDDTIYGGSGNNQLFGDKGNDQCFNSSGKDKVKGCESVGY